MAKTVIEKRKAAAEASRRWRAAHPERAKQIEREAYHRRREREGKKPREFNRLETPAEKARKRSRKYYEQHAEKVRAKSKVWYRLHAEEIKAAAKDRHLKRLYGLTPEQFAAMGTVCGICGSDSDSRSKNGKKFRLAVDHDHATGKIRGVLCSACNCGIGYFKHDEALMQKAIEYLRRTA